MAGFMIFAVSTPLQLLNAIEACFELAEDCTETELWILVKSPQHWVTWRCAMSIESMPFSHVRLVELCRVSAADGVFKVLKGLFINSRRLRSWSAKQDKCSHFFLGNPKTPEHLYLASLFPNATVTVLDDGTGTASFLEYVQAGGGRLGGGVRGREGVVSRLKDLLYRLFYGAYRRPLVSADFYTAFVAQAKAAGYTVRKNQYSWLASRLQARSGRIGTHFLGAPFVERNELEWCAYRAWLQSALSVLPAPVLYVAHWAESDAQLARIEQELGIPCDRFELPYELQYLRDDIVPACVASWFSSALDVLSMIPGTHARLLALKVPVQMFRKPEIAKSALSFYARHEAGKSVVELIELSL